MIGAAARSDWSRRYPPLLALAGAIVLAVFAFPSSLVLPQANPGQTLEYAPVPPNGQAPPGGNFSSLGLGSSGTLGANGVGGAGLPPPPAAGSNPNNKDCVGNPPRQTEDPLSPPCVAYYQGDNGGATYTGVTRNEVTVLFRFDVPSGFSYSGDSHPDNHGPPTGYYDMDNPSDVNQFFAFVYLHDWEVYFNDRYQTYNRRVHFWAYNYNQPSGSSYGPSNATSEATDNWTTKHPFATLQNHEFDISGNFPLTYATYLAQRGALSFGSYGFTQDEASRYPGLFWSYPPSPESQAEEYATFVCQRIVKPGLVSFSNNGDTGKPRKYGLLLTNDPSAEATQRQQQLTVQDLKNDCGVQITDTEYFRYSGGDVSGPQSGWGVGNMAHMRSQGVTTILWPGGAEVEDMTAASQERWYPEWVLEGDGYMDGLGGAGQEPGDEMAEAWVTTPSPLIDNSFGVDNPCLDALTEVDPNINRNFADITIACFFYDDLRQLFTGVQLAGPHLTPSAMDQGHAIPAKPSTSPYVPSCYYLSGDYTCVKDAAAEWWDSNAHPNGYTSTQTGCWRMWHNGQRYLIGQWPPGDVKQGVTQNDVCNLYNPSAGYEVRTS